jgi:hypothetical protein
MRRSNRHNDLRRAVLFVKAGEERVARQKRIIARLVNQKRSAEHAKIALADMEQNLLAVRNYHEVLQTLLEGAGARRDNGELRDE